MSTNATASEECSDESSSTAFDPSANITGPHTGYDAYGNVDYTFYRCETCGRESANDVAEILHAKDCPGN